MAGNPATGHAQTPDPMGADVRLALRSGDGSLDEAREVALLALVANGDAHVRLLELSGSLGRSPLKVQYVGQIVHPLIEYLFLTSVKHQQKTRLFLLALPAQKTQLFFETLVSAGTSALPCSFSTLDIVVTSFSISFDVDMAATLDYFTQQIATEIFELLQKRILTFDFLSASGV